MLQACAVYGYEITRPIDLGSARLEPILDGYQEAHRRARNLDRFYLTATLTGAQLDRQFLFHLEAVLAFVERLDVLITDPVDAEDAGELKAALSLTSHKRHSGGGAVLPEDAFFPESRARFIRQAMDRLSDKAFCDATGFNILFFKYVETFRQRKPFIEVTWFLLYSGLEAFARAVQKDYQNRNSSMPITRLLLKYGFDVAQQHPSDPVRSMSTYMHLRNALFHNGERDAKVNVNGTEVRLGMTDYLFNFQQLVALTILKAVGFDDGHIHWNSWVDRQPFK